RGRHRGRLRAGDRRPSGRQPAAGQPDPELPGQALHAVRIFSHDCAGSGRRLPPEAGCDREAGEEAGLGLRRGNEHPLVHLPQEGAPVTLQGRVRAAQALQRSGLDVQAAGPLERASSITNEVWYAGPWVVRVNARPRRGNLRHEAEVARMLPPEVGYPEVVDYGEDAGAEWLIHRRIPGVVLSMAWPALNEA